MPACRLALIGIVLLAAWILQFLPIVVLQFMNTWRGNHGREPWALPQVFVPPRLLLMVISLTIMPLANSAGQMLGAGGHTWMYAFGGIALGFVLMYLSFLTLALLAIARKSWALGVVYGAFGVLQSPGGHGHADGQRAVAESREQQLAVMEAPSSSSHVPGGFGRGSGRSYGMEHAGRGRGC